AGKTPTAAAPFREGTSMKTCLALILAIGLAPGINFARADDTGDKIANGASETGKTLEHGAKGVGLGAAKLYHDAARGVHRAIARHTHDPHKQEVHEDQADRHHEHAESHAHQSEDEVHRAGDHA